MDVGDPAAIIRAKVHMLLHNGSAAVGANMNLRKIQRQEFVRAASDPFQIFGLVLDHAVRVNMREIVGLAGVHCFHISA